jgi:hypothetical protein
VRAFAENAQHLTALTCLILDVEGCIAPGPCRELAKLIQHNAGLAFLTLTLAGPEASSDGEPEVPEEPEPACIAPLEQIAICEAISQLQHIENVTLEFDVWFEHACDALVNPRTLQSSAAFTSSTFPTDKHLRSLQHLQLSNALPLACSVYDSVCDFLHGEVAMHALANLPALSHLHCKEMHFSHDDVKLLLKVSCMPNLRSLHLTAISIPYKVAMTFAGALGSMQLPGLWSLKLSLETPALYEYGGGKAQEPGGDAALCAIVDNLPPLPSLQVCSLPQTHITLTEYPAKRCSILKGSCRAERQKEEPE